jgi:hypothetical protein
VWLVDMAKTARWRLTKRKGRLATFPGQWVSAPRAGTTVAARTTGANHLNVVEDIDMTGMVIFPQARIPPSMPTAGRRYKGIYSAYPCSNRPASKPVVAVIGLVKEVS